jgi:hypothetical protein
VNYYDNEPTAEAADEQVIPATATVDPLDQAEIESAEGDAGDALLKRVQQPR